MANQFDWNQIKSKNKKTLSKSKPIFIIGSREMSQDRIKSLAKKFLDRTKKDILWGCLKEKYIEGLENSPQFRTLPLKLLKETLQGATAPWTPSTLERRDMPRASEQEGMLHCSIDDRISILTYHQRDLIYIFKEIDFSLIIFINGSWHKMLHTREELWTILDRKIPYKMISPFVDEKDATNYTNNILGSFRKNSLFEKDRRYSDAGIMKVVGKSTMRSFDHTWQTGCLLAKKKNPTKYSGGKGGIPPSSSDKKDKKILLTAHNKIIPYETYAMHHGSLREKHFTPPNDMNNYDTIHAEIDLIIQAQKKRISLKGTSLYIDLMPCPTCAKMIAESDIEEVVYRLDHSNGYAFDLLKKMGKKVRRI